ncbi:Protein takeout [Eumeta japonica]|uniref:Protein takeout n=1 Tax=Eumeta variegata TaxID=151549 RepID=A0A4C1U4I2_EUMVA|nr:Protein takeout [Eumeta japonica]
MSSLTNHRGAIVSTHCYSELLHINSSKVLSTLPIRTSDFTRCYQKDPKLNDCLRKAVPEALKKMKDGIPSLSVPPMEPLLVSSVEIKSGGGPVLVTQSYRDIKLHGLTDSTLTTYKSESTQFDSKVVHASANGESFFISRNYFYNSQEERADLKRFRLRTDSLTPKMEFVGDYVMSGRILVLPIQGKGVANITMVNLVVKHDLIGEKVEKDGQVFMHLKDYKVKFIPQRVVMHFTNLFNGDERLGKQMNSFLNENWELVFNELKQSYEDSLSSVFKDVSNRIFDNVPMNKIFLED